MESIEKQTETVTLLDLARRIALLWNSGAEEEAAERVAWLLKMAQAGNISFEEPQTGEPISPPTEAA